MLPPIGRRQIVHNELYSFVVFRKGLSFKLFLYFENLQLRFFKVCRYSFYAGKILENEKQWPRVLKKAVRKKQTARCRLCCPDGKLRIVTLTKNKHGK